MKKTTILMAILATACCFSACKKDGVYNPKEKIAAIYQSSDYSYSYYNEQTGAWEEEYSHNSPKSLAEKWNWDGKKLSSIDFYYTEEDENGNSVNLKEYTVNFTYDGKQLTKVTDDSEPNSYIEYSYDGKKIDKITMFYNGAAVETYTFSYDGKKIDKITLTYEENDWDTKSLRKHNVLQNIVWRSLIPDVSNASETASMVKRASKGSKSETMTVSLTWDGNNISKASSGEDAIEFTYDDKKNPLGGFLGSFGGEITDAVSEGFDCFNKNNVLTVKETFEGDSDYSETINFSYTYDGKWPVTRTNKREFQDDFYHGIRNSTIYIEYAD
jgi:hypothetical protein